MGNSAGCVSDYGDKCAHYVDDNYVVVFEDEDRASEHNSHSSEAPLVPVIKLSRFPSPGDEEPIKELSSFEKAKLEGERHSTLGLGPKPVQQAQEKVTPDPLSPRDVFSVLNSGVRAGEDTNGSKPSTRAGEDTNGSKPSTNGDTKVARSAKLSSKGDTYSILNSAPLAKEMSDYSSGAALCAKLGGDQPVEPTHTPSIGPAVESKTGMPQPKTRSKPGKNAPSSSVKPFVVCVQLGPYAEALNITVSPDDDPSVLTVDDVDSPGLIATWNAVHTQDQRVCRGDIIVSVNDFTGTGREMLDKLCVLEGSKQEEILLLQVKPGINRATKLSTPYSGALWQPTVLEPVLDPLDFSDFHAKRVEAFVETLGQQREVSRGSKDQTANEPTKRENSRIQQEHTILRDEFGQPVMLTNEGNLRVPFLVEGNLGPGNMNLGIAIGVHGHPTHLTIEDLWTSGLIAQWNNAHGDEARVRKGDLISSINGKVNLSKEDILKEIDEVQKISIHQTTLLHLHVEPGCMKVVQRSHGAAPVFY